MNTQNTPLRRHFQAISLLAVVVMAVDMYYSGKFGYSIDAASMIGLSAISLGSGLLLVAVIFFYRQGFKLFGQGLACVWAICFAFNILSNMGVATSNRVVEVEKSNLKQAIHTERGTAKEEAKGRLVVFREQLATLINQNGWAATVTAEGLRQQVADLRVARESEANLGGCGQKCRAIENQISDIQGKISVAEQRQNLDKQIAASQRVLAEARNTLATTDAGVSNTAAQASLYSRWTVGWLGDGESISAVRNANELMGIAMAFVIAVASAGLTLAGVWQYLMSITPGTGARPFPQADHHNATSGAPVIQSTAPSVPSIGMGISTVGQMNMERLRQRLNGQQVAV